MVYASEKYKFKEKTMSNHVFVVSEWLAKPGHETEAWALFKNLMTLTKEKESGCISARCTKQIAHPGSPGKSKYQIVLMQEYDSLESFDRHCAADYVVNFAENYVLNKDTGIIADWRCRLFSE